MFCFQAAGNAASGGGKSEDAFSLWLRSVKRLPKVYNYKLATIDSLLRTLSSHPDASNKASALQHAINLHLRDQALGFAPIAISGARGIHWSNFQRLAQPCVTFTTAVGVNNNVAVSLSAAPGRPDLGYQIVVDANRVRFFKHGKLVSEASNSATATPASSVLLSSYLFCYLEGGSLLYGRANRVLAVYQDRKPEPCRFYGFSTTGPDTLALSAITPIPIDGLECPLGRGTPCNSPHGSCSAVRQCQCQSGWVGSACHLECPSSVAGICSNFGTCTLDDPNNEASRPYCECQVGSFGLLCEYQEQPKV
jgi:hypothetical protein